MKKYVFVIEATEPVSHDLSESYVGALRRSVPNVLGIASNVLLVRSEKDEQEMLAALPRFEHRDVQAILFQIQGTFQSSGLRESRCLELRQFFRVDPPLD
jgi:hypothetical protein